jgi:diacylglycerol kinase (ATP)
VAAQILDALASAGHEAQRLDIDRAASSQFVATLHAAATSADVVVIAGGDGTVHHALPALVDASAAVYHYPMGTENLFAREFAMRASVERLRSAIDVFNVQPLDVGIVSFRGAARPFAIMCSIGPDAGVVDRISAMRQGSISHLSYTMPIVRELASPRIARMSIEVDGVQLVRDRMGMLVVANARQYALRMDPAHRAVTHDGLLDVTFLPATSGMGAALWLARSRLRERHDLDGSTYAQGSMIRVSTSDPRAVMQIDGEAAGAIARARSGDDDEATQIEFTIKPAALRVLDCRVGATRVAAGGRA